MRIRVPYLLKAFGIIVTCISIVVTALTNWHLISLNYDKLVSQYYSDSAWSGTWSTQFEGYVDSEDMRLTEGEDLRISLDVKKGEITGLIATNRFCSHIPYAFIHLEGNVRIIPNVAYVTAFDFFQGKRQNIARLRLIRESNGVVSVELTQGPQELFPTDIVRLGYHPLENAGEEDRLFPAYCRPINKKDQK